MSKSANYYCIDAQDGLLHGPMSLRSAREWAAERCQLDTSILSPVEIFQYKESWRMNPEMVCEDAPPEY